MSVDTLLPLDCLRSGEWAEVVDVSGDPAWVARLAELGLRTGVHLQMLRNGWPCLIHLNGARLSLRGESAWEVLVRPVPRPSSE